MSNLAEVTTNSFQEQVLDYKGLTLVDFWASWCGPCKMLAPTLEAVQNELGEQINIVKLDVESYPEIAQRYRVTNIPLMLLFKDGEQVGSLLGNQPKAKIVGFINDHA